MNVTTPPVTIDCLKPSATAVSNCNTNTGVATVIVTVVNPDASAEMVQVSTLPATTAVTLTVGANGVPATSSFVVTPATPPAFVVTDASETPVLSQTLSVTPFTCVAITVT